MKQPSISTAINNSFESNISNVHTCLPGQIEKYDYKTQKADVLPLIKKKYLDGTIKSMPVIANVPIVWPRGGGGSLTFPLNRGDGVLLVFAERSIDTWLSQGGESEPGDRRKFDISDAIGIPGLFPFTTAGQATNNEDFQLTFSGTTIKIKANGNCEINAAGKVSVDGTAIELGATILNNLVNDTFLPIFDAHTHLYSPGPITPQIPTLTPIPISVPTNKTTKTKAQ